MVNATDIWSANYNLSAFLGTGAVDNPANFVSNLQVVSHVPLFSVLLVGIGLVLFFVMRNNVTTDSEALAYSGLITSISGILLFLVQTTSGVKLVSWFLLAPIFLITAFALFSNMSSRNY